MKRKQTGENEANGVANKKRTLSEDETKGNFRNGLFNEDVLTEYAEAYANSVPYKHGVIRELINDDLLRSVRCEIFEQINFTPKETDIYKIHQSGDLANLDGLDDKSLKKLPSVLQLRNALYSGTFREWISKVANSGPLSGRKTDMAVNVYTPGCHLLCHDDVIGSRRLSYILYLTDPDKPWQPEWGGALRLYPTETLKNSDGLTHISPSPEFTVVIPPSFNQLSFFTIQPGESFHDVEEVFARKSGQGVDSVDGGRIRMAVSGWFHIPQVGEDGYIEGLEEQLAEKSSLRQLEASKRDDQFELPRSRWQRIEESTDEEENDWTAEELQFLANYINPTYLVPDTLEELGELFGEASVATLDNFLKPKFADKLKQYIESLEAGSSDSIPARKGSDANTTGTARPPHKRRFIYRHSTGTPLSTKDLEKLTPLDQLLDGLLPSPAFAKLLHTFTDLKFSRRDILARRFRKGQDYTLATNYDEETPQLELLLGITPTPGWGGGDDNADDDEEIDAEVEQNGKKPVKAGETSKDSDDPEVGGYEAYMVGDDDEEVEVNASGTGAGHRQKAKADPAIYKASGTDEEDPILFSMPACWNTLSVVLRDRGILKFVKYVSASAQGDRWDIASTFSVVPEQDEDEDGDEEKE